MLISLIAALDRRGLIGDGRGLPWHLPSDLRRFRALTWGKPVIMGRTTFESLGKPLPGRLNIVLSRNPEYVAPGGRVARSFREALSVAEDYAGAGDAAEAMVIGGGRVYAEAIPHCDRLYLTLVEGEFTGSTFFPVRELLRQSWRPAREPETHAPDEKTATGTPSTSSSAPGTRPAVPPRRVRKLPLPSRTWRQRLRGSTLPPS
jgi:dihydrofolate reductase